MDYLVEENCLTIFLPREVDHHYAEEIKKEADRLIERKHIKHVIFDFKNIGNHFINTSYIATDSFHLSDLLSVGRGI